MSVTLFSSHVTCDASLESGPGYSFPEPHKIPRSRVDEDGVGLVSECSLHVEAKLDVVDSRKIARARGGRGVFRLQAKAHNIMKAIGNVRVELVRNHGAPVRRGLLVETRRGVEEEFGVLDRVTSIDPGKITPVVTSLLALSPDGKDELKGRVIEGKRNSAELLVVGLEVVLRLHKDLFKMSRLEAISLRTIQIDI